MPDDFDLFPDRKNLDPFSFGKEEKPQETPAGKQESPAIPLFPQPEAAPPKPYAAPPEEPEPEKDPAGRKAPKAARSSKLTVIGGMVLLLLALAWAAQNFLLKKKTVPPLPPPQEAQIPTTPPVPAPQPVPAPPSAPAPQTAPALQPVPAASPPAKPAPPAKMPAAASAGKTSVPPAIPTRTASVAPAQPQAGAGVFTVQVGAVGQKESLDAVVKKLKEAGYEALLKPGHGKGSSYTVMAGPFPGMEEAARAEAALQKAGLPAILLKREKTEVVIRSGVYPTEEKARIQEKKVKALGLPAQVQSQGAAPALTLVRVGRFESETEAIRVRDDLIQKGFPAILVRL